MYPTMERKGVNATFHSNNKTPEVSFQETTPVIPRATTSQAVVLAPDASYIRCKRALDVCVAAVLLTVLSPVFAIIALIIFVQDGGPVFYSQARIGQDGQPFMFFKFRSMVRNADSLQAQLAATNEAKGPIFKMRRDPRITPAGRILRRYSLDELPQLLNVLRGDMSLVGPRPHRPSEVEQYLPHHYERLSVTPGLICLREVSGRSNLNFDQWLELDLHYINYCRSLTYDLQILARAIPAVIRGDGAY